MSPRNPAVVTKQRALVIAAEYRDARKNFERHKKEARKSMAECRRAGMGLAEIAKMFGVSTSQVCKIVGPTGSNRGRPRAAA